MPRKCKPLNERLMAKVSKSEDGCWLWTGTVNGSGYGTIGLGSAAQGKGFVHRVSYEIFVGCIPNGMIVCHRCDVKTCVNPGHLFVGTYLDNIVDAQRKGRWRTGPTWASPDRIQWQQECRGERHGQSKLTDLDVVEIRRRHATGATMTELAKQFPVSRRMIANIVHRRNWSHI